MGGTRAIFCRVNDEKKDRKSLKIAAGIYGRQRNKDISKGRHETNSGNTESNPIDSDDEYGGEREKAEGRKCVPAGLYTDSGGGLVVTDNLTREPVT